MAQRVPLPVAAICYNNAIKAARAYPASRARVRFVRHWHVMQALHARHDPTQYDPMLNTNGAIGRRPFVRFPVPDCWPAVAAIYAVLWPVW